MPDEKKAIENIVEGVFHGAKDGCSFVRTLGGNDEGAVAGAVLGGFFGAIFSAISKK
uniref:Bacteriocin class II with double-glycine leader peptide n=1 Tax=Meloidogyne incognita TaxID=6306 RepID=A0A914KYF3_MELIC